MKTKRVCSFSFFRGLNKNHWMKIFLFFPPIPSQLTPLNGRFLFGFWGQSKMTAYQNRQSWPRGWFAIRRQHTSATRALLPCKEESSCRGFWQKQEVSLVWLTPGEEVLTASSEPLCANVLAAVQTLPSLFPQTEERRDKRTVPAVSQSLIELVKSLIWIVRWRGRCFIWSALRFTFLHAAQVTVSRKIAQHRLLSTSRGLLSPYLSLICI